MIRVDGFYLYTVGSQLHPLTEFRYQTNEVPGTTWADAEWKLTIAAGALEPLLHRSVFRFRAAQQAGAHLLTIIQQLLERAREITDKSEQMNIWDVYQVTSATRAFESVMSAELGVTALYIVMKKAAFDTADLIEQGQACFPQDLPGIR